jgi:hypothetical protein
MCERGDSRLSLLGIRSRHSFVTVVCTLKCENPSSAWAGSAARPAVGLIPSDTRIGSTYESAIDP